ncbi:MAG: hypothetical protein CME16_06630 [Gemmatimonadetes bacterium]|nr:hypothetical protein [Gemmatimonadota bacterium]
MKSGENCLNQIIQFFVQTAKNPQEHNPPTRGTCPGQIIGPVVGLPGKGLVVAILKPLFIFEKFGTAFYGERGIRLLCLFFQIFDIAIDQLGECGNPSTLFPALAPLDFGTHDFSIVQARITALVIAIHLAQIPVLWNLQRNSLPAEIDPFCLLPCHIF